MSNLNSINLGHHRPIRLVLGHDNEGDLSVDEVLFLYPLHAPVLVNMVIVSVGVVGELTLIQLIIILALDIVTVPDDTPDGPALTLEHQLEAQQRLIIVQLDQDLALRLVLEVLELRPDVQFTVWLIEFHALVVLLGVQEFHLSAPVFVGVVLVLAFRARVIFIQGFLDIVNFVSVNDEYLAGNDTLTP